MHEYLYDLENIGYETGEYEVTDTRTHEIWDGEDRSVPQEQFDGP